MSSGWSGQSPCHCLPLPSSAGGGAEAPAPSGGSVAVVTTVTWQPSCVILDTCCLSSCGDGRVSRALLSDKTRPCAQTR